MNNAYHIEVGDSNSGYGPAWWSETTKMVSRGWKLFCEKRGLDPSQVAYLDVKRRKRGRPRNKNGTDADQSTSPDDH